jgi:hypothetical protein
VLPGWFVGAIFGLLMGFALGGSFYWGAYGPNITQAVSDTITQDSAGGSHSDADVRKERADEALARYTYWLMLLTGIVALATFGLVVATVFVYVTGEKQLTLIENLTERQTSDTRVLQRAYITVLPRGVAPYLSTKDRLGCDVGIYNAGNLPAREVSWCIGTRLSRDPHEKNFPIKGPFYGNNIIPPKSEMRKGAVGVETKPFEEFIKGGQVDDRWLYIWGQVRYKDGFEVSRSVAFCHRYNLLGFSDNTIPGESGRVHEHGNHESPSA